MNHLSVRPRSPPVQARFCWKLDGKRSQIQSCRLQTLVRTHRFDRWAVSATNGRFDGWTLVWKDFLTVFGLYVTDFSQSFTEGDLRRRPVTPGPVCASIDRAAGTFQCPTVAERDAKTPGRVTLVSLVSSLVWIIKSDSDRPRRGECSPRTVLRVWLLRHPPRNAPRDNPTGERQVRAIRRQARPSRSRASGPRANRRFLLRATTAESDNPARKEARDNARCD